MVLTKLSSFLKYIHFGMIIQSNFFYGNGKKIDKKENEELYDKFYTCQYLFFTVE